jgi:hypothetical protein
MDNADLFSVLDKFSGCPNPVACLIGLDFSGIIVCPITAEPGGY